MRKDARIFMLTESISLLESNTIQCHLWLLLSLHDVTTLTQIGQNWNFACDVRINTVLIIPSFEGFSKYLQYSNRNYWLECPRPWGWSDISCEVPWHASLVSLIPYQSIFISTWKHLFRIWTLNGSYTTNCTIMVLFKDAYQFQM